MVLASSKQQCESSKSMPMPPPLEPPPNPLSHTTPPGCHRAPALGALHHPSNSHWLPILHFFKHIASILGLTKSRKTKWELLNIKWNLTYVESKMEKTPQMRVNALSIAPFLNTQL